MQCKILLLLVSLLPISLAAQFSGPPNNPQEYEEQYNWRIRQTRLNGVYIPKDLPEAITELNRLTDQESRERFATLPEEDCYHELFHSLGRWIRRNWGFNGGSRLSAALAPLGLRHPDDLAQLVIVVWHRSLNDQPHSLRGIVERIKEERQAAFEATKN
ncbi:MAG: DUF6794 domain-containing protein [Bacteroidota bacterium]